MMTAKEVRAWLLENYDVGVRNVEVSPELQRALRRYLAAVHPDSLMWTYRGCDANGEPADHIVFPYWIVVDLQEKGLI